MTPVSPGTVTEALNWRYATKKFDPGRKISPEAWSALEQALVLAPSSYGLQPWKFVVVEDPGLREKLHNASRGQRQPMDCSHFVVFARRINFGAADVDRFIDRVIEVRGGNRDDLKGYRNLMASDIEGMRTGGILDEWAANQIYIALGQFMAAAALLGVDACPMEGIEPSKFDEILGLADEGCATEVACAAGHRAGDDRYAGKPKVRFKPSEVILRR